jgi:hypothetical protein
MGQEVLAFMENENTQCWHGYFGGRGAVTGQKPLAPARHRILLTQSLQTRLFDLITAFRFFPTPSKTFESVMSRLSHLKPSGSLFNNHRQSGVCSFG